MTLTELLDAKREVEIELGIEIPDDIAMNTLEICKRKLICSGKGEDYLPLLYRYELPMKVYGTVVNARTISKITRQEVNANVLVMLT